MLRRLVDSNVKTLSDGEVTDGERKGLWLPLRRMGIFFFFYLYSTFIHSLICFHAENGLLPL